MMILIFEVSSWLLYDIDYLDLSAIIPEQKLDFQRWRLCMKKAKISNRFAIPFVFKKHICLGFSMITHVRTVHGCLSYSLLIFWFFRYSSYDSKVCFIKLDGGGWVVVCVCVCGRACGVGVGGGGGDGALAPRRGWCRRSTRHSFLKTRFCLRLC